MNIENNNNVCQTRDLLDVVEDYTFALDTLDNYDYERLTIGKTTQKEHFHATYENAMQAIGRLRDNSDGSKRIADGTLVALTLMIAESRPEEKDVMVKVVVNLIGVTN